MKGIHLIFIFSIISQTVLFSQVVVKRNNQVSKELANVNWSKEYTLFDYTTDEPIFPLIRNGQPVYKIYYASKEDPRPNYGELSIAQVEGLKYYKFKNRETCFKFCLANKLNAVPTLTTTGIASITTTSAISGGNITTDGGASITARGVVWSTSTNPTITLTTKTSNGTGTGSFSSSLTNLTPKTTYYVRAYATNSAGTGYGNEITFTTSDSSSVMGIPCPGTPTVKDIDGNTYNTVQIGTQCWTKENLRVTKYIDGSIITLDESGGADGNGSGQTWGSKTTGARTVYGHSAANLATYGYLYNWYAVADTKGLCPSGWHVPTSGEWSTLTIYLGGMGNKMKKQGITKWSDTRSLVYNESGFSAIPAGYRDSQNGIFGRVNNDYSSSFFWSTSDYFCIQARSLSLYGNYGGIDTLDSDLSNGKSIRCIKDSLKLTGSVPTISTTQVSEINSNSAASGGIITSDGGKNVLTRGVVWWTYSTKPITFGITIDGTGTGSFTSTILDLTPNTTYYVKAYATNVNGKTCGNKLNFTTTKNDTMGIPCPGTPTVKDVDGNTYNTVQIGTQCWTKENLRVTKYRDGSVIPLDESGGTNGGGTGQTWSSRTTGARTVYGHNAANLATYGYLYNWYAVADSKGLCPSGWHVPSDSEWTTLTTYLGGESVAGGKMKSTGTTLWSAPNAGATNESGFSGLPVGERYYEGNFRGLRNITFFWSRVETNDIQVWGRFLSSSNSVERYGSYDKTIGGSVRCLLDTFSIVSIPTITTSSITAITTSSATSGGNITSDGGSNVTARGVVWSTSTNPTITLSSKTSDGTGTGSFTSTLTNLTPKTTYYVRAYATNSAGTGYGNEITFTTSDSTIVMGIPCPGTPTVKDIDGNTYNTVQIGTQCWTKENLRVTKYRDGTVIPLDESGGTAGGGTGQTWSSRTTGARTVYGHSASNLATYGYLYNWYAVADTKGLCPSGWHLPLDGEWTILTSYLGGESVAGGKMKSTGTTYWVSPNTGATNESGFSALPGGCRNSDDGSFNAVRGNAYFWSAAEGDFFSAWFRNLNFNLGYVTRSDDSIKSFGASVRCLKDTFSIVSIPTLTTTTITAITSNSAISGGNITADGGTTITARGVVWSISTNPTIALTTKTTDGSGTGSFTSLLTNLAPKITYYVRAYATNSAGTGYGNEISFTTSDSSNVMGIPCPGTPTVKDIDGNTYNTVQIGTQCWTKENLRVTKYRDGTIIPLDESGGTTGNGTGQTWSSRTTGARTVYGHNATNLATYGYLYNWYTVADSKGICFSGWHVPSDTEWTVLTNFLGGSSVAGGKMKTIGTANWNSPNTGATNESGFSALPSGYRLGSSSFLNIRVFAWFWSATESDNFFAWFRDLDLANFEVNRSINFDSNYNKIVGASVRCLKDTITIVSIPTLTTIAITSITTTSSTSGGNITSDGGASISARGVVWSTSSNPTIALTTKTSNGTGTGSFTSSLTNLAPKTTYYVRAYATNSSGTGYGNEISFTTSDSTIVMGIPCPGTPTVKDIDGNTYNTVQIGTQCWTKENLRVTKYRDGSVIPLDESGGANGDSTGQTWRKDTGYRTIYGHSASNLATYGYLYNWFASADTKGLCPSGWHVPINTEWTNLINYLGGDTLAGGKMKSIDTVFWNSPNTGATNESGFSALPGGVRNYDGSFTSGSFRGIRVNAFFWSAAEGDGSYAWYRSVNSSNDDVNRSYSLNYTTKSVGASVRCLKDTFSIVSIPTLTTTELSGITTTTATSGGNITAGSGDSITARGVVWSTSTNPTITLTTKTTDGSGTGSFTSSLTNLAPKTTYYVRAYATNSTGTGYGNEISFTTAEAVMNIPCPGLPTVEDIDGNTYNTVKIGTQCWMKENLRVTKYKDGTPIPMVNDRDNWNYLNNGAWCWYNNDSISFNINHGKLYNWYAATDKQGICPNGWHLGTLNDWNNIINFLEGEKLATIKLKTNSGIWWTDNWTFYEDLSGFSALPSGKRSSIQFFAGDDFSDITYSASFILPEEVNYSESRGITLNGNYEIYKDTYKKRNGASVRCMKDSFPINVNSVPKLTTLALYSDTTLSIGNGGGKILSDGGAQIIQKGIVWSETKNPTIDLPTKTMDGIGSSNFTSKILNIVPKTKYYVRAYAINREGVGYGDEILFLNDYTSTMGLPCLNYPTVQDIDGNVYTTVQIGTQCWMKENLRVTKYNYGIEIPLDTSGGYWGNEPRQTWTNRKTGAITFFNNDLNNLNKFGYLYNAYVTNSNGGNICPIGWHVPSDGDWSILTKFLGGEEVAGNKLKIYGSGTNESGFSGLAGGFRESSGSGNYRLLDAYSYFLSSSKHDWSSPNSSIRIIYAYGSFVFRLTDKSDGLSIRCVKD